MPDLLKFEGLEIGQQIKAFDFEPMKGRPDKFIEGQITGISTDVGYNAFVVRCSKDSWDDNGDTKGSRVGQVVYVPMETPMDYDERITVI